MNEDMVIAGSFFFTVIVLALGIPLVRAYARRQENRPIAAADRAHEERLARIEHAIEAVALEVERISEGQRFVTRLLSEREPVKAQLKPEKHESP
jgi:demethoxyubiquinone hydroxylase (CLK1/Coq7/Cat5 family)